MSEEQDLQRKLIELLANIEDDDEDVNDLKIMAFFMGVTYKMWKEGKFTDILPSLDQQEPEVKSNK